MDDYTIGNFSAPMYIMAKPAGAGCNLDCRYCYYTEKSRLYPGSHIMSDAMLDLFIRRYIEAQTTREILFTWHGGEPLLRPVEFYRKAIRLQHYYGRGLHIDNCIQTNGTLITDEWCRLFKDNGWLVGVSVDGPEEYHDKYRVSRGGKPTFADVMRGIEKLDKYGVEWNAMAVINNYNADHPREFYQFFKDIGCHYIQFAPIVERARRHTDGRHLATPDDDGPYMLTPYSVTPAQWGDFLCGLFDMWIQGDVGKYYIQIFDATLANWVGEPPGVCILSPACGVSGVLEANGDVYSCDHYVFPQYRLGNITSQTLVEMMYGERQRHFGASKLASLPDTCRQCPYLRLCNGECPKNRFATAQDGQRGLNYLCEGYRRYYEHTSPYMRFMADELSRGQSPANVMNYARNYNAKT